jgi:hypothetical protein
MAAQNQVAVRWLGNAWAQVVLSRVSQAAPGLPIPPNMPPAVIDFWTAMADPVVECFERYLTSGED